MLRKLQKSGARGYKVVLPSAFTARIGVEAGESFDVIMGEELRYTVPGLIPFPAQSYELKKVPYGSGLYLSVPKKWADHHGLYSGCEVDIDDRDGDIIIRSTK